MELRRLYTRKVVHCYTQGMSMIAFQRYYEASKTNGSMNKVHSVSSRMTVCQSITI